jgi:hypothetical protein
MSAAEIIEQLPKLTEAERRAVIAKLRGLDAEAWDREIEEDAKSGNLDRFAEEALKEYHAGKTEPFPPDAKSGND